MSNTKHLESMIFNFETTGRTDFRGGKISAPITTKYKGKGTCLRTRPPPLKDIHTLVDWYVPNVPLSLYHKPKDIVRTNPRDVQKAFLPPEDEEREEAQRTRPQLVMTPAVSMDDIKDNSVRERLVKNVYQSETKTAMEQGVALTRRTAIRAPLPGYPAPPKPVNLFLLYRLEPSVTIVLEKLQPPYVCPEWRMDSVTWDRRQFRFYCDSTKEFWLQRTPKCEEFKLTAEREAKKKMEREMRQRS